MPLSPGLSFDAAPYDYAFVPEKTALIIVDMQGTFLHPDGYGVLQTGGELEAVQAVIPPIERLLAAARAARLTVIYTREGHLPDLSDCPTPKLKRQKFSKTIGDTGPDGGRLLVQGEKLHDIVPPLAPLPGDIVIDKPGKGAFYYTDLQMNLIDRGISHLLICGVTTECCVISTAREANDRGFETCIVSDCTGGYQSAFRDSTLDLFSSANGLFGYTADSKHVLPALQAYTKSVGEGSLASWDGKMDIETLSSLYQRGVLEPQTVIEEVYKRIAGPDADPAVWLHLMPKDTVQAYVAQLVAKYPDPSKRPPLFGIPFSVKDSIDYGGVPTTGACPAYSFVPKESAPAVELLLEAGGIFIGKVNLDQLATGLVGMRSPYGQPASTFSKLHVSGGSSSGSCVSVASKQVSFSLATDTAGSGRVPAAFNGIVGFKPTRGRLSARGVVPCCLELDCLAVSAATVPDAKRVFNILVGFDAEDPFAKAAVPPRAFAPRAVLQPGDSFDFAAPPETSQSWSYLCPEFKELFIQALALMSSPSVGGKKAANVDYTIFEEAGKLLYEGSFVAQRVSGIQEWYAAHPPPASPNEEDCLLPEIRTIYEAAAKNFTALDAWRDKDVMAAMQRKTQIEFRKYQVLIVPTAPVHPTKAEYLADPIGLNHRLGKFTHYGNILDMCGVAIPAGFTPTGMPFGITVLGQSFTEGFILEVAARFERALAEQLKGSIYEVGN